MTLSAQLQTSGVQQLELLVGPRRVLAVSMTISRQCAAASAPGWAWCSRARGQSRA